MVVRRPRALRPGDRVAIVSPGSPSAREPIERGVEELARWGFEPVLDERVFAARSYVAGEASLRAAHLAEVWRDPSVAGIFCARGGYGSVQLLPLLDPACFAGAAKVFVGYSDITTLLGWLTLRIGQVAFHGPMLEGCLGRGDGRYDRSSFARALASAEPMGALAPEGLEIIRPGEISGVLVGGTLTQLVASLGTPWAFDPPPGHLLFLDEVNERPYRLDRMLTQLGQAGILARTAGILVNELPGCDEPSGSPRGLDVIREWFAGFPGPIVAGFPSGHTARANVTLPLGVRATLLAHGRPALVIEEAAVE